MEIYTVKRGDSLYAIGRRCGIDPQKIALDNDIEDPRVLAIGQHLLLIPPGKSYTVRAGDTIDGLAVRFGVSPLSLYQWNPVLGGKPALTPGTVLTVAPADVRRGTLISGGYLHPGTDESTLRKVLPYLTYASLLHAGADADGGLYVPEADLFLRLSREYRVQPLLVILNTDNSDVFREDIATAILESDETINAFVETVVEAVTENGYGGAEIDFEYIPAAYAERYAAMLGRLRSALNARELVLFAAVAPKGGSSMRGDLYEGHIYGYIGNNVDGVRLVAYEWENAKKESGPVAPLPRMKEIIDYAKSEIRREKIILGIPLYGYDYTLPHIAGESVAETLSPQEAVSRAIRRRAEILYDETAAAPHYEYYDREGGRAVRHEVWFEDPMSLYAKLDLLTDERLFRMAYYPAYYFFTPAFLMISNLYHILKIPGDR